MIGNTGFEMTPAAEVPDLIEKHLHGWLTEWLASAGVSVQQVHSWALHAGGPSRPASPRRRACPMTTCLFILNRLHRLGAE